MKKRHKYITVTMLKNAKACQSQRRKFKQIFGEKVLISKENFRIAIKAGLDVGWVNDFLPYYTTNVRIKKGIEVSDSNTISPGFNPKMKRFCGKVIKVSIIPCLNDYYRDTKNKWLWIPEWMEEGKGKDKLMEGKTTDNLDLDIFVEDNNIIRNRNKKHFTELHHILYKMDDKYLTPEEKHFTEYIIHCIRAILANWDETTNDCVGTT